MNVDPNLLKSVLNAADINLVLDCGRYTETLPTSSVFINGEYINVIVGYHSAVPYTRPTYNVYLCYSNLGELAVSRFPNITGYGRYGGLFGLPSCDYYNHYYKSRNWIIRDCYHEDNINIQEIIRCGISGKVKLEIGADTYISDASIFINYTNNGYSIRLNPIGIINGDNQSMEISNFEITDDIITRRSWTIQQDAPRFTKAWLVQKLGSRFKSEYMTYKTKDCKVSFYRRDPYINAVDYIM